MTAFLPGYLLVRRAPVLAETLNVKVEWLTAPPHITNPSVTLAGGGVVVAARTATYRLSQLRRSMVPIPGRDRTTTHLLRLRPTEAGEHAWTSRALDFPSRSRDREFEDARIFEWNGSLWGLWSESQLLPDGGYLNSMALGRIEDHEVVDLITLRSPHGSLREKNWMPIVDGERLFFVYDLSRLEVYEYHPDGLELAHRSPGAPHPSLQQSGSSQFVPFGGGWLGVAHRSLIRPLALPWFPFAFYRHSFVLLNEDFSLRAVSNPFFFTRRAIEFCAGITIQADQALLSFGVGDEAAALARMDLTDIGSLLEEESWLSVSR